MKKSLALFLLLGSLHGLAQADGGWRGGDWHGGWRGGGDGWRGGDGWNGGGAAILGLGLGVLAGALLPQPAYAPPAPVYVAPPQPVYAAPPAPAYGPPPGTVYYTQPAPAYVPPAPVVYPTPAYYYRGDDD